MKRYLILLIFPMLVVFSCQKTMDEHTSEQLLDLSSLDRFARVLSDTNLYPPVITPEYIYHHLDKSLVLDLRAQEEFKHAHIANSRNVKQSDLFNFLSFAVHPASFDDIVLVSQCGQGAVFAATLLQLLGYNNVFALSYGMAGWNKSFSNYYQPIKYKNELDNYWQSGRQHSVVRYQVDTSKFSGVDWKQRGSMLLQHSVKDFLVRADSIVQDKNNFVILDYRPASAYEMIHLKGAVNLDASKDFNNYDLLSIVPTDRPVVIYSCHPYKAIALMAYLRLLGYDAYALSYGFHELLHQKVGKPFEPLKEFKQLPVIIDAK